MQARIPLLLCLLTFIFISLSASTSSCDTTYQTSQPTTSSQPGTDYRSMARQDAINAGINPDLFERQINQESGFNPSVVSPAGAIGISQIMPATAQEWNVDPWNASDALKAAAEHMAWYQARYGTYAKALACYNAGCSMLLLAEQNCLDFYWCLPKETRQYILVIMGDVP
jgi:soluble lytic murein transglycosylase-like protein